MPLREATQLADGVRRLERPLAICELHLACGRYRVLDTAAVPRAPEGLASAREHGPAAVRDQERRVATRSRLPSGSVRAHSRPASPSSSTGIPNSSDTASMSLTYRWIKVSGRASPLCSDRYSRTLPRATETNQGKSGSN